jgi:hypothetical protein
MGIAQAVIMSGDLQPQENTALWVGQTNNNAGMLIPTSDPDYANLYPGTSDFCWETWLKPNEWYNQPATLVAWSSSNSFGIQNFGLGVYPDATGGAAGVIGFAIILDGYTSTQIATLPSSYWNTWFHVAMSKTGTTINVWAAGILVSQITGVTTSLDYATLGGNGHWLFTGPVGDRDESFTSPLGGFFRNMRYVIGNNVYGNSSTITPPPLTTNISAITGTQYIWWTTPSSTMYYDGTYIPDYDGASWQFTAYNGSTGNPRPQNMITAYPSQTVMNPYIVPFGAYNKGTWTNNGTAPNQPKITTGGPTPLYGTSIGDFTATGTDVRISSTDTWFTNFSESFLIYIWFYIPATITNECKSIITAEVANGFQLNIGRPGQGLDWLSVYAKGGAEKAYAPHIWARNAWNFLCIEKIYEGSPGPVVAWAGANGDTVATNLNLTDTGAETFTFASGTVSIGCPAGSTVSCQMYFNQILGFNSAYDGRQTGIFPYGTPTIPIIDIPTQYYLDLAVGFDFQGTNGQTSIQPIAP